MPIRDRNLYHYVKVYLIEPIKGKVIRNIRKAGKNLQISNFVFFVGWHGSKFGEGEKVQERILQV